MEEKGSFNFRWVILGVSFITLALTSTIIHSFSIFFVALLKEFAWSRSITAGAFSLFMVLCGLTGPFVGNMLDRFGPKTVFVLGAFVLGVGLALCSMVHSWWQFYISYGVIAAMGAGASGWVPTTTVIQNYFKEKRGLAMGILSSGVGIGIFVCVPSIQYLIERVGWRMTYRIMAVFIPFVVIMAAILFLKMRPETNPSDATEGDTFESETRDSLVVDKEWASRSWTLRQAIVTKPFWFLSVASFLSCLATHSVLTHQVAFFVDAGLEALFASYIAGLIGLVSIGGKIFWGTLSDRIGREITYTGVIACSVLGILLLITFPILSSSYIPYLYAVFFGMGYAGIAVLPPLVTVDLFEGRAYGSIFGTIYILYTVGGAFGAWSGGFFYDQVGSYTSFLFIVIGCTLFACFNIWIAAPRKIRNVAAKKGLTFKRNSPS